jgi:histone H3/H4
MILVSKMGEFPQKFLYLPIYFLVEVRKMADLPIAAVVRIAKKNGAERVGSDAAEALVVKAEKYIAQLTKESNKLAEHAGRKTIKKEDVDLASKSN